MLLISTCYGVLAHLVETACLLTSRYLTYLGCHTFYEAWHRSGGDIQRTPVIHRVVGLGCIDLITRVG